jgi:hypothetical protein
MGGVDRQTEEDVLSPVGLSLPFLRTGRKYKQLRRS